VWISLGQEVTGSISGTVHRLQRRCRARRQGHHNNSASRSGAYAHDDEHGQYARRFLPVGHYSVSVEIAGFKKIKQSGFVLNVSDKLAVNFTSKLAR